MKFVGNILNSYVFRKVLWILALTLPLVLFLLPFTLNYKGILPGDWDYFAQLYEAARQTILHYHQFPWWNPWTAGGIPLYANPQFGLFSIQMPFVLIFGTITGLRLSILAYYVVGFWGMRSLLMRLKSDTLVATLLSYIWVFSSFPVWHISGGHLTFGTYLLAPWFFYLLLNINKRSGWLWLGLYTAFLVNQSVHYMTIHILLIGSVLVAYQIVGRMRHDKKIDLWPILKPYLYTAVVVLPLIAHKLYFTLQYLHDYPRIPPSEHQVPFNVITAALTFRGKNVLNTVTFYKGGFGWTEYAAYFGLIALGLVAYIIIQALQKPKNTSKQQWVLLIGLLAILLISIGNFSPISPYALMKHLPFFNQMQVSSRWLGWFVFGSIVLLAKLPRKRVFIILLALCLLDVFQSSFGIINASYGHYTEPVKASQVITQEAFHTNTPSYSISSFRLLHATQSNVDDIYGYEPIVGFGGDLNYGYQGLSSRCSRNLNPGCDYVMTNNAKVVEWTPNKITLKRIGDGPIIINQNPGSYWKINGEGVYRYMNVVELRKNFVINSPSNIVVLTASGR